MTIKPVCLIILDGWGIREYQGNNAIKLAHTPNVDRWLREHERAILDASGEAVGLSDGQMGNSEVGHLNLGAGRVIYQAITRIDKSIREGAFFAEPALLNAFQRESGRVHILGLFSPGGVHSHTRHLLALLRLAKQQGIVPVLHLITDGRDTPPNSAIDFLRDFQHTLKAEDLPVDIATVSGRYYAMDRDKRWERTQAALDAIVHAQGQRAANAEAAIEAAYTASITDEFIQPSVIGDRDLRLTEEDAIICFNFRADRMRQIVSALLPGFDAFDRGGFSGIARIATLTQYENDFPVEVVFPPQAITNTLAEVLSQAGVTQYHAAETEKYAHVTYFFNGGVEHPYPGEERAITASPKVATYDLKPEMSAPELTASFLERIASHDDDFLLINFANPDMVGHTGDLAAAIKACETVDACAARIVEAVRAKGGVALVTADHGNAEIMRDEITGEPHTYHTTNPVSFIAVAQNYIRLRPRGILGDVAPTILELLGIDQPPEMTGDSLLDGIKP
jgi:2,3-bisphosphoglycerate-independent phosphoglycerate mutase